MIKRKNKLGYALLLILVLCVTIGYALLNTTLTITGKSNISKNIWDVHFENIMITSGSVTASVEPVISYDTIISNFELILDKPGDFYEFYVDVINNGTIDAMIESVVKIPDLTDTQKKYINYIVEYQNGEEITKNQLVNSGEYVRIKVKVEYKKDLTSSELPTVAEVLTLGLDINYIQADDTGIIVPGRSLTKIVSGDGTKTGDEVCIGEECFYVMYSDDTTITMLSKYNLYVGNECTSIDSSSCTAYGEEATGKQDSTMLGYSNKQMLTKGAIAFSDNSYWRNTVSSYPAYVYNSSSILYNYVENYKTYLDSLRVTINEARLITYEELTSLNCSGSVCHSAPNWVYLTSYWAGATNSSSHVWGVINSGYFVQFLYHNIYQMGVRPVIVISKSDIVIEEKKLIEFTIDGTNYQAIDGMTWGEWVSSDYNTVTKYNIPLTIKDDNSKQIYINFGDLYYLTNSKVFDDYVYTTDKIKSGYFYYLVSKCK